jgi:hypothetical protein
MITQNKLRKILNYNLDTGVFTWRERIANCVRVGTVAGSSHGKGYWRLCLFGKNYLAHRLAWLYVYGYMPKFIDHINGLKNDNRLQNLRACSHSENLRNRGRQSNNKSGYKGVSWNNSKRKWIAQIMVDKKLVHIGYFQNSIQAANAYILAAIKHHGEFANL